MDVDKSSTLYLGKILKIHIPNLMDNESMIFQVACNEKLRNTNLKTLQLKSHESN